MLAGRARRPDLLRRRQESPAKRRTQPHLCKCQRSGEGTFFLVRALRTRLGVRLQRVVPAAPPSAGASSRLGDRHMVLRRCCILLLYQALELWAQDFEFASLVWVELRGFEPLTSCMPFPATLSGDVVSGLVSARQSTTLVRLHRIRSGLV